jgi:hypothetical protein
MLGWVRKSEFQSSRWEQSFLDPAFNFEMEISEAQLVSAMPKWDSVETRLESADAPNILDVTRWIDIHARA